MTTTTKPARRWRPTEAMKAKHSAAVLSERQGKRIARARGRGRPESAPGEYDPAIGSPEARRAIEDRAIERAIADDLAHRAIRNPVDRPRRTAFLPPDRSTRQPQMPVLHLRTRSRRT